MTKDSKPPQTVANFCLSKDLHHSFNLKINSLSGLTQRFLQIQQDDYLNRKTTIANTSSSSTTKKYDPISEKMITYKLKEQQTNELFISVCLQTGDGKQLTCAITTSLRYYNGSYYSTGLSSLSSSSVYPGSNSSSRRVSSAGIGAGGIGSRASSSFSSPAAGSAGYNGLNSGTSAGISGVNSTGVYDGSSARTMLGNKSEWLSLPINYSQLPLDAVLKFELFTFGYETGAVLKLGKCLVDVFDKDESCTLIKGHLKLKIDVVGDNTGDKNSNGLTNGKKDEIEVERKW
ncbi:unnamed protein product [Ambrosiozyma monospora]|uniref:Unnamed protein product n=1 Tax=Ambrosiozyma monospora TaxID=43982 RepID=A0ACB5SVH3_AMBMO|nr:unnamed protein product [Ambrosiozyma monospora]